MKLLEKRGCVTPEDSRTHIRIPFEMTQAGGEITIQFEYGPKVLEDMTRALKLLEQSFDCYVLPAQREKAAKQANKYLPLKNLITLSLDDPNVYRGACHRHDAYQQLKLSELRASPGLVIGKLPRGQWTATLSFHCIVTGSCDYRLQIDWTDGEGER
ncbi:hypothetical protein [Paenibacillus senegalensis]|uniref:hypothetical protein n=1 Tax=Paenibacillus senegalensis TaxID=1465766 RepID=UPI000289711B|nr:hypothetical protein [Paenibacillus senegalensis]